MAVTTKVFTRAEAATIVAPALLIVIEEIGLDGAI